MSKVEKLPRRAKMRIAHNLVECSKVICNTLEQVSTVYLGTEDDDSLFVTEALLYARSLQKTLQDMSDKNGRPKTISE